MDPVPDPLLLGKSGSAGNRTRDLRICSQKLWPLDHRGGHEEQIRKRNLVGTLRHYFYITWRFQCNVKTRGFQECFWKAACRCKFVCLHCWFCAGFEVTLHPRFFTSEEGYFSSSAIHTLKSCISTSLVSQKRTAKRTTLTEKHQFQTLCSFKIWLLWCYAFYVFFLK